MAGLEAALLAILVSSMFASLTLVASLYLWSITGLAVAMLPAESTQISPVRGKEWLLRVPAVAVACVFFFFAISLAAQDAAWAELRSAVARKDFSDASEAFSQAISSSAGLPGYELWASREMASLGRSLGDTRDGAACWKEAAEASARAEKRSEERFMAAYQSSVLAIAAGNLQQAELKAREAIKLAPNWYKGHLLLSQILQIAGRNQDAAREAQLSETLGWKKP
jgi:hypothetical protein